MYIHLRYNSIAYKGKLNAHRQVNKMQDFQQSRVEATGILTTLTQEDREDIEDLLFHPDTVEEGISSLAFVTYHIYEILRNDLDNLVKGEITLAEATDRTNKNLEFYQELLVKQVELCPQLKLPNTIKVK